MKLVLINFLLYKVTKGIENLFPKELFKEEFYSEKETSNGYGGINKVQEFDKNKFQDFVLGENNKNHFEKFEVLFDKISESNN